MKIGLIGCAGLGKSALAKELSKALKLPVLLSKDVTRPILAKYGYKYSEEQPVELFLSRCSVEFELLERRMSEEKSFPEGFIADRTALECFCYAFLNLKSYTDEDFSLLENLCKESVLTYDRLYFMPFGAGWFLDNGIRTISCQFQRKIDMMLKGLVSDWDLKNVIHVPIEAAKQGKALDFILKNLKKDFF